MWITLKTDIYLIFECHWSLEIRDFDKAGEYIWIKKLFLRALSLQYKSKNMLFFWYLCYCSCKFLHRKCADSVAIFLSVKNVYLSLYKTWKKFCKVLLHYVLLNTVPHDCTCARFFYSQRLDDVSIFDSELPRLSELDVGLSWCRLFSSFAPSWLLVRKFTIVTSAVTINLVYRYAGQYSAKEMKLVDRTNVVKQD